MIIIKLIVVKIAVLKNIYLSSKSSFFSLNYILNLKYIFSHQLTIIFLSSLRSLYKYKYINKEQSIISLP